MSAAARPRMVLGVNDSRDIGQARSEAHDHLSHSANRSERSEFEYQLRWLLTNARTNNKAQYYAADAAERKNYYIGLPAVVLGAVVSTSIFAALGGSPGTAEKIIAGTLAALAAALAAIQTFFNFSAKAKAHRSAAAQFGDIRRRCEFVLFQYHLMPDGPNKARFALDQYEQLIARQTDLAASSPDAAKYWDRASKSNRKADRKEHKKGWDSYSPGIPGVVIDERDPSRADEPTTHQDGEYPAAQVLLAWALCVHGGDASASRKESCSGSG